MPQPSVAIRLGFAGKEDAKRAFADIGEAGDAAAKRFSGAFDRASNDVDAALRRQAAAAQKLASIAPATATQQAYQAGASTNYAGPSARDSAAAFQAAFAEQDAQAARAAEADRLAARAADERAAAVVKLRAVIDPLSVAQARYGTDVATANELLRLGAISTQEHSTALAVYAERLETARRAIDGTAGAEERLEQRTQAFLAALDPVYAAQQRFDREMGEARSLISAGTISLDQYCDKLREEQGLLEATTLRQNRAGVSAGAHAAAMQNVSYQAQDAIVQLQAGTPVLTVLTQQGTQAAAAMNGLGGSAGKFAAFMSSGWGLAVTGGIILAGMLATKILEANAATEEGVNKLRKDADAAVAASRAKEQFSHSIEGVTAALVEQRKALDQTAQSERSSAERANIAAREKRDEALAIRQATVASLEAAKARLAVLSTPGASDARLAPARDEANAAVAAIETQLKAARGNAEEAERQLNRTRVDLAVEQAKLSADPIAKIAKAFDDRAQAIRDAARRDADRGAQVGTATKVRLEAIEREKAAAIKAEQERQRALGQTERQLGRIISLGQARGIVEGIGGRVTSAERSSAEQARLYARYQAGQGPLAAKPGHSNHELGQALDIAKTPGMTLAKITAAFQAQGVRLIEKLDEGTHFHVAWSKKASAERAISEANEDAAKEAEKRSRALADLTARFDPAAGAAEKYRATLAEIAKLDAPNADVLRAGAWAEYAKARAGAFELASVEALRPEWDANDKAEQDRADAVRQRAETVAQMLADQRDELALSQRSLALVGTNDNLRDSEMTKLRLILDLKRAGVDVDSADGQQLLANADAIATNEAALKVASARVDEFRGFAAQLVDDVFSPSSWSSWEDAGKSALATIKAELIKLALLNPIKNWLNGDSALPTIGDAILKVGSLFGGGGTGGSSAAGISSFGRGIGRNAGGTHDWSGGLTWVNENGGEIVDLPSGARIYPASVTRQMMGANDNVRSAPAAYHFDLRGAVVTQDLLAEMNALAASSAARGAAGGATMAAAESRAAGKRRLGWR